MLQRLVLQLVIPQLVVKQVVVLVSSTLNKEEVKLLSVGNAIIDEEKKEVFMVVD